MANRLDKKIVLHTRTPTGATSLTVDDVYKNTEFLKTNRNSGVALLQSVWDKVEHIGDVPDDRSVHPNTTNELPIRLCEQNFEFPDTQLDRRNLSVIIVPTVRTTSSRVAASINRTSPTSHQ